MPASMTEAATAGAPIPDAILEQLREVSTATATAILNRLGLRRPATNELRPLSPGLKLVGRARTLKYLPLREDLLPALRALGEQNPQRVAIESLGPGDVFVIDAMGQTESGSLGDILTARVRRRGAAGVVVDGTVRDAPVIAAMGYPVFVRGGRGHPAANTTRMLPWEVDVPVQLAGLLVAPGDIILADDEAVVCIPRALAAQVAEEGVETERKEAFLRMKIEEGLPISLVYPPKPEILREYEEWRTRQQPGVR
jgi:5-oxopent-3-ene-1,2,5-tricarboxylate decarboxylase/2-hydroxyhepta-2,4-diene-1,7-dioate isomerase